MARQHIDFFHAQQLPWETGAYAPLPGVQSKTLSTDDETGACTVILRYPPCWSMDGPWHLAGDVEFYLLDGKFELNGQLYTLDCYSFHPAGWVSESASTETGADIITFFEGQPDFVQGRPEDGAYDLSKAIPFIDTFALSWTKEGLDPDYEWFTMRNKILRVDPATKACTLLVEQGAQHLPKGNIGCTEAHPTVEEIFILSGEVRCPYGVLSAGMYLYRPPDIRHGPYFSRFSNVMLLRLTGELDNNFSEPNTECSVYVDPKPRLPDELAQYREMYKPELY